MPLNKFRCPDNQEILIKECLEHCRMANRCVTKPTLYTILAGHREWAGRPSTTQLLNGTMLEWLKVYMPYAISPRDMAYSLLGSTHHTKLAGVKDGLSMTEEQVSGDSEDISGIADLLTPDEETPGSYELVDYKTYGSYKVAQILGLVAEKHRHPTEVYQRSGSWGKAGSPKIVTVFNVNPLKIDRKQEERQLNHYRVRLEARGFPISKMNLQITVRDGNTQVAKSRGVTLPLYYPVEIHRLPDQEVMDFFQSRAAKLVEAIKTVQMPEPCNEEEAWDGLRCQDYCEVATFCPKGQRELQIKANKVTR